MDELFNGQAPVASPAVAPGATAANAAAAKRGVDLSSEIERTVAREPMDRVRCVRVFDDYYRCNWWSPLTGAPDQPIAEWARLALHRVRKSRFISARREGAELLIEEVETAVRES